MPPLEVPDPLEAVPEFPALPSGMVPVLGVSVSGVSSSGASAPEDPPEPSGSSVPPGSPAGGSSVETGGSTGVEMPGWSGPLGGVFPSLLKSLSP